MSDNTAAWKDDPTGRHDHRYWDGTEWTEHVADAGVAGVDPYEVEAPAPDAPATGPIGWVSSPRESGVESEPESSSLGGWTTPARRDTPSTGADPASAWTAPGWSEARPPEPDATTGHEPTAASEPVPEPTSAWPAVDQPTAEQPAADRSVTEQAAPAAAGGDRSRWRRGLLVLLVLLVVAAVVVAAVVTGDNDDDPEAERAVAADLSEQLQDVEGAAQFAPADADCIADEVVDDLGEERLDGIDILDEPPAEDRDDFQRAFDHALEECEVDVGTGSITPDDGGLDAAGLDGIEDVYARGFKTTYDLTDEQASCLAKALTDAIRTGEVGENEAFTGFFEYLDGCGIPRDKIDPSLG